MSIAISVIEIDHSPLNEYRHWSCHCFVISIACALNHSARTKLLPAHVNKALHTHEQEIKAERDELDELQNSAVNFVDQIKTEQRQNAELHNLVQNMQSEMKKLLETLVQQQLGVSNPQAKSVTYKMTSDECWYCD